MQKNIQSLFLYVILFIVIFVPNTLFAENVTMNAVGEYVMGDNDTYIEAKKLALQDAKRNLLEKVGTYIESTTEVKGNIVKVDEIKQYTAGIVKVEEISDEKSILSNKATVVKVNVKATVDPDVLIKQVMNFRNRKDVEESAKKTSAENDKLRKEIEQLNQQLHNVVDENKYQQLNAQRKKIIEQIDTNEKGLTLLLSGEGLYSAALLNRQKKEEDKEKVKKFLKEIASVYNLSATTPEISDNGDGTADVTFMVKAELEVESAQTFEQPYNYIITKIKGVNLTNFLSTGLKLHPHISPNGRSFFVSCGDFSKRINSPNSKCDELEKFMADEENKCFLIVKLGEFEERENLLWQIDGLREFVYSFKKEYNIKVPLSKLKSLSQLKLKVLYDLQEYGQ